MRRIEHPDPADRPLDAAAVFEEHRALTGRDNYYVDRALAETMLEGLTQVWTPTQTNDYLLYCLTHFR